MRQSNHKNNYPLMKNAADALQAVSGRQLAEITLEAAAANSRVPLMMAHGTADTVVPLSLAERSRELLCEQGYTVEWHSYPMQHALCDAEILDIRAWLVSCLSAAAG